MTNTLEQLAADLVSGRVRVIDLTQPLSPDTPVIQLPPEFAPSPGLSLDEISCYDEGGPAWYWNTLHLGEHTGTHFDAPSTGLPARTYPRTPPTRYPRSSSSGRLVCSTFETGWRTTRISFSCLPMWRLGKSVTAVSRRAAGCCCAAVGRRVMTRPRSSTPTTRDPTARGSIPTPLECSPKTEISLGLV